MATKYGDDGGFESEERASLYIDTTRPVSLQAIGVFLETIGREVQRELDDPDFVVELAGFEQGSLNFLFKKRRRREQERQAREIEQLELARRADRRGQRMELYAVIGALLMTPPAALAANELMMQGAATEIVLEQPSCTPKHFSLPEIQYAAQNASAYEKLHFDARYSNSSTSYDFAVAGAEAARYVSETAFTVEEKRDMLEEYEHGRLVELAGKIMPRKSDFFKTASGTKLPILANPAMLARGKLASIEARIDKEGDNPGIVIEKHRLLNDI